MIRDKAFSNMAKIINNENMLHESCWDSPDTCAEHFSELNKTLQPITSADLAPLEPIKYILEIEGGWWYNNGGKPDAY